MTRDDAIAEAKRRQVSDPGASWIATSRDESGPWSASAWCQPSPPGRRRSLRRSRLATIHIPRSNGPLGSLAEVAELGGVPLRRSGAVASPFPNGRGSPRLTDDPRRIKTVSFIPGGDPRLEEERGRKGQREIEGRAERYTRLHADDDGREPGTSAIRRALRRAWAKIGRRS
jgi:hypothetical protein